MLDFKDAAARRRRIDSEAEDAASEAAETDSYTRARGARIALYNQEIWAKASQEKATWQEDGLGIRGPQTAIIRPKTSIVFPTSETFRRVSTFPPPAQVRAEEAAEEECDPQPEFIGLASIMNYKIGVVPVDYSPGPNAAEPIITTVGEFAQDLLEDHLDWGPVYRDMFGKMPTYLKKTTKFTGYDVSNVGDTITSVTESGPGTNCVTFPGHDACSPPAGDQISFLSDYFASLTAQNTEEIINTTYNCVAILTLKFKNLKNSLNKKVIYFWDNGAVTLVRVPFLEENPDEGDFPCHWDNIFPEPIPFTPLIEGESVAVPGVAHTRKGWGEYLGLEDPPRSRCCNIISSAHLTSGITLNTTYTYEDSPPPLIL